MRKIAVVLAGGTGTRVGHSLPKQLIEVAGRSILAHSLAAFDGHPLVEEVVLVMAPGHDDAAREIVRAAGFTKVTHVLEGGESRTASTLRALAALGDGEAHVLVHDAARPLVTARIITDCFRALETRAAVTTAVASADTVIELDDDETIADVPARARLRRVQTPQGFHLSALRTAYALAVEDPDFTATDDCTVVLRYTPEVPIGIVEGDERNLKVTGPTDLVVAERLLELAPPVDAAGGPAT